MLLIGLTGSIGMGKSTVATRLRQHGIPVIDADAEVHKLYAAGGAAVGPIEAAFPGTTRDGAVDRERLSAALLADPRGFERLNAIVHPLVRAAERALLAEARQRGARFAVLEVPLLFETGGDHLVDVTIVVSAPETVQRQRVLARPGMSPEKLDAILARQMSDAEKRRRADFVVETGGTMAETEAQVDTIVTALDFTAGARMAAALGLSFRSVDSIGAFVGREGAMSTRAEHRGETRRRCEKSCSIPKPPGSMSVTATG